MRHFATLLVLLMFTWVASGAPAYLHAQQHGCKEKTAAGGDFYHGKSGHSPKPGGEMPGDEPCVQCLILHVPQVAGGETTVLMALGEWVPFVTMRGESQQSQTFPGRFSCRGPPVGC